MPANTIKVCRPGPFGNPFLVAVHGQAQAVALHRLWLMTAQASDLGYTGETAVTTPRHEWRSFQPRGFRFLFHGLA
jgi:hypothetical protein